LSGPALIGIIVVVVGAAVIALMCIYFQRCVTHTHTMAVEQAKSLNLIKADEENQEFVKAPNK